MVLSFVVFLSPSTLPIYQHVNSCWIQFGFADLMLALWYACRNAASFALVSSRVVDSHGIESRKDSGRLLGRAALVLLHLRLVPAGELIQGLATEVLHVDDVLELGDQLVTLSAMQHELGARVGLITRLDQLYSLFLSHVLIEHGQDVNLKLCRCPLRDLDV